MSQRYRVKLRVSNVCGWRCNDTLCIIKFFRAVFQTLIRLGLTDKRAILQDVMTPRFDWSTIPRFNDSVF